LFLVNDETDLFLGEEKNIFQNDDLGVEIDENDEMFILLQMKTLIPYLIIVIKRL